MTLGIPGLFPPRGELVNYNYFDTANGTGYDIYYGITGSAGETFTTTNSNVYSETVETLSVDDEVPLTYTELINKDFDITFNLPRTTKGKLIINVPTAIVSTDATANQEWNWYIVVTAYHYDGSTETPLGNDTSKVFGTNFNLEEDDEVAEMACCIIDISKKHFKKGETLRFTIQLYAKTNEAGVQEAMFGIGHDPKNRNVSYITNGESPISTTRIFPTGSPTIMTFHVPFVIDI